MALVIVNGVVEQIDLPQIVVSTARIVSGTEFLALWTPAEVAAGIVTDPRLLVGAFKALSQNSVNLASQETAALLALAVSKGVLTADRAAQIAAGTPPSP